MARPKTPTAEPVDLPALPEAQITLAQHVAATVTDEAMGWMDAARAAGRMEMTAFFATVADRAMIETYLRIKKTKAYVDMPYRDADGNLRRSQTLDEFCRVVLGKSRRRLEELATNYHLLGPELYEQAEKVGLGQRDYNALKALPADDQAVIRQALEGGADHETVIEQLVTLTERHAAQKTTLEDALDIARQDIAAKNERARQRSEEMEHLREQLISAQHGWRAATPDEQAERLRRAVLQAADQVRLAIAPESEEVGLRGAVLALADHADAHGIEVADFLGGVFVELIMTLRRVRDTDRVMAPVVKDRPCSDWEA